MNDIGNRLSFLALRVGSRLLAVPHFHKGLIELTGYTLDRWDLHGVPCSCPECTADYETLRVMQLATKTQAT